MSLTTEDGKGWGGTAKAMNVKSPPSYDHKRACTIRLMVPGCRGNGLERPVAEDGSRGWR